MGLSFAWVGLPNLAQAEQITSLQNLTSQASSLERSNPSLSDGVYLYGQSPQPETVGSAYVVFEVEDDRVVGAFYMPYSSFDCFQGEVQDEQLALNVVDSYERTVHPYSLALDASTSVASAAGQSAPVGLEGYHAIAELSENDQRMLEVCQTDFQPQL
ncbi:MAG: hypothetical protein HC881_16335 [Leptolyngbyaceae cyanobacterium SL_7_1]|nr:hypothetical protein [Leptolyngbyaceae cyanobacterium SL_7_1]